MNTKADFVKKKYKPLKDKTLRNALGHCIGTQFPRIGGPRIRELCADMLLEVFWQHVRPSECSQHGQVRPHTRRGLSGHRPRVGVCSCLTEVH